MRFIVLLSICLGLFCIAGAKVEEPPRMTAQKLSHAPKMSGDETDPVWAEASHVTQFWDPITGKVAVDQTEVWIGYDQDAIYVAFHAHESEPERMVGREIRAGSDFNGEDAFDVRLNTFGSQTWNGTNRFEVNLLNTQSEDLAGGRSAKREWRGIWQSTTRRRKDGWSGTIRIPWLILNYPKGSPLKMDLNFGRHQARNQVFTQWANQTANGRAELQGIWEGVEPPKEDARKRWDFQAYAAPETEGGKGQLRFGGDLRYTLSPTMSSLISISPDFKNIENQIAGNEFTRTERYLGETRPFFTEGGDYFGLGSDYSYGQLFYAPRITQFDIGGKVYGKPTADSTLGAMVTEQFGVSTAAVAKFEKQFTPFTSASAFMTYAGAPGMASNQVLGFSASHRKGNFTGDISAASERNDGQKADTAGSAAITYSSPKWFSTLRGMWIQPDFAPPLAFIPWTDRRGYYSYSEYNNEFREGPLLRAGGNFYFNDYQTFESQTQERGYNGGIYFTTRKDLNLNLSMNKTRFSGGFDDIKSISITPNNSNRFRRFTLYYENGLRGDQPSNFVSFGSSWRAWRRLDLGFQRSILILGDSDGQTIFTASYEFSPTLSVTGRYVDHNGEQNSYFSIRNGGGSGTEYYLIVGDPNSNRTVSRVSVKIVWAF